MTATLHIDFETRSAVDLRKTGVYVYAEDPTTDVWCAAYAFNDDPVEMWLPGQDVPRDVTVHVLSGCAIYAHNANFERVIWKHVLAPRYGWPEPKTEQWRCTMAMAYAMALPGSLDAAAEALQVPHRKDAAGGRLMLQLAKPRKVRGTLPAQRVESLTGDTQRFVGADGLYGEITWWTDDAKLERLYDYCKQDVEVERALEKRLYALRPFEQRVWALDQEINDRGVNVDVALCEGAKAVVGQERKWLNDEIKRVTGYRVGATTNVNEIEAYLRAENPGLAIDGLDKAAVSELLARDDLTEASVDVLELRQEGAKMSVSKIDALLRGMSRDGRARGLLQYHAAGTGRWGGRRFQPQNLLRPDIDQDEIEFLISALKTGDYDTVRALADRPITAIGNCIRGMVAADDGKNMAAADFANIEGRVLAWLAGEAWKVKAFEDYDAGAGPDLYKVAYSRSFGAAVENVTKDERQIGKVQELALGYQGGPGAFQAMAKGYGLNIGDRFDQIAAAAGDLFGEAQDAWETYGHKSGMSERNWIAAEIVKRAWRGGHPATVSLWSAIEDAAVQAVRNPGSVATLGRLKFRLADSFLWMQLPSNRALCYPYPAVETKRTPWGANKELVTFYGQDTYTRKWGRTSTYGGKLTENAVQAIARDLLAEAMLRLADAGADIVLTVHDEIVLDVPADTPDCDEICRIMSELPPWAAGLPVSAEGWVGERYRK